jgi:hypothetical protein
MKNLIPFGLAAAAMLASCSDELVSVNTEGSNIIGFSTSVNKSTRATDIDASNIGGENTKGFSVYGWTAAEGSSTYDQIFNDEAVTGSDGNYTYTNLQYWEKYNSYRFHAIAPYRNDESNSSTTWQRHWKLATTAAAPEEAKITFTNIESTTSDDGKTTYTASGDQDLVYAFRSVASAEASGNSKVDLDFSHLLSRVKFRFVGDSKNPSSVKINVEKVTLKGAYAKGDITITNKKADAVVESSVITAEDGSSSTTLTADKWDLTNATTDSLSFGGIVDKTYFITDQAETAPKYLIPADGSVTYDAAIDFILTAEVGSDGKTTHEYKKRLTIENLPAIAM